MKYSREIPLLVKEMRTSVLLPTDTKGQTVAVMMDRRMLTDFLMHNAGFVWIGNTKTGMRHKFEVKSNCLGADAYRVWMVRTPTSEKLPNNA